MKKSIIRFAAVGFVAVAVTFGGVVTFGLMNSAPIGDHAAQMKKGTLFAYENYTFYGRYTCC